MNHPTFCTASIADPAYHHHHKCPLRQEPQEGWRERFDTKYTPHIGNDPSGGDYGIADDIKSFISSLIEKVRQEERRKAFTMNSGFFEKGRQDGIQMERERLLAWIEQEIQIPPVDEYQAQRNATLMVIRRIITNPTDEE